MDVQHMWGEGRDKLCPPAQPLGHAQTRQPWLAKQGKTTIALPESLEMLHVQVLELGACAEKGALEHSPWRGHCQERDATTDSGSTFIWGQPPPRRAQRLQETLL